MRISVSVPEFDDPIPATCDYFRGLVEQPLTAYADQVVVLESGVATCTSWCFSIPILSVYHPHHTIPHIWNRMETRKSSFTKRPGCESTGNPG